MGGRARREQLITEARGPVAISPRAIIIDPFRYSGPWTSGWLTTTLCNSIGPLDRSKKKGEVLCFLLGNYVTTYLIQGHDNPGACLVIQGFYESSDPAATPVGLVSVSTDHYPEDILVQRRFAVYLFVAVARHPGITVADGSYLIANGGTWFFPLVRDLLDCQPFSGTRDMRCVTYR